MGKYVLTVCNDETIFNNLRKKWLEDGIAAHMVSDLPDVVNELSENPAFLLIVAFLDEFNQATSQPFRVLSHGSLFMSADYQKFLSMCGRLYYPAGSLSCFISASNEPSSRACADIWRMPRESNL